MDEHDDDTPSSSVSTADRPTDEADEASDAAGESEEPAPDEATREGDDAVAGGADREDGDTVSETLSAIAQRPAGDVETALSEIVADGIDDTTDSEAGVLGSHTGADLAAIADEVPVDEDLVATVREADPETTARAIQLLRLELGRAEEAAASHRERAEDLESRLKRKQADFQNYKKRQKKRKQEEIERATEDLVSRLLDVRDNLKRALDHDDADIRSGVESTLAKFDNELERENVEPIEPDPGDEVDPQYHEVLATIAAAQPEDRIAERHRPGYEMAGKVLRPAQVAVSDGSEHDSGED